MVGGRTLLLGSMLLGGGCSLDALELDGKRCPCVPGFVCAAGDVCVPAGEVAGAAGSASGDGDGDADGAGDERGAAPLGDGDVGDGDGDVGDGDGDGDVAVGDGDGDVPGGDGDGDDATPAGDGDGDGAVAGCADLMLCCPMLGEPQKTECETIAGVGNESTCGTLLSVRCP